MAADAKAWAGDGWPMLAVVSLFLFAIPLWLTTRNSSALIPAVQLASPRAERLALAGGALRFDEGASALRLAFEKKDLASLRLLLEQGANPNRPVRGEPLLFAASTSQPEIVELLLAHGADPQLPRPLGHTALARALNAARRMRSPRCSSPPRRIRPQYPNSRLQKPGRRR